MGVNPKEVIIMTVYLCKHCKNQVVSLHDSGVPMKCCGENMEKMVPNTADGAKEKHVPVLEKDGANLSVKVGSVEHPMTEEHYIQWIALDVGGSVYIKYLKPTDKPEASFKIPCEGKCCLSPDCKVYEYCNLHGLYSAPLH